MLSEEDKKYLEDLDEAIWTHHPKTDRSYAYSTEKRNLTPTERKRVTALLEKYRNELIFEPGSGTFGFGVSLSVYIPPSYPGVDCEHLITITGKHAYPDRKANDRAQQYKFVEQFTHTDRNKELRKLFGFKHKLHDMAYYDY